MSITIGIIGSGHIGTDVATLALAAGHDVVLSNSRGPASLVDLVNDLGDAAAADTVRGAAERADIVVLALPINAYSTLPTDALDGKVVVDATNYYPERNGVIAELVGGAITSSEFLSDRLPGARIVKGLNNVDFIRLPQLARPSGAADRSALPIAGDDRAAKSAVTSFLDAIGFDALDLGDLAEGWRSQPGTPIYVAPYFRAPEPPLEDPMLNFVQATSVAVPADDAERLAASASQTL